ncbi:aldehyde dehydrogenase family protein [Streptomyces cadmiisoli]|uniref:aldehyde dehydrogenase family protein n=1 Tax=Streptomyces cadmiisoli TaxID=2184053 RepID=UPI00365C77C3
MQEHHVGFRQFCQPLLVRRAGLGEIPAALGSSIGGALMENADYMMFTGSTASGRKIARDAGERLIGASLELGGKNAMLVLDDADIEKAADGAIAACFPSAGQLCISIERLYVAEAVHDRFVAAFVARTEKLKLGGAYDYSCDIGSLSVSVGDCHRTCRRDALAKGATLLADGTARPDLGPLFHEPTILTAVTADMYRRAAGTQPKAKPVPARTWGTTTTHPPPIKGKDGGPA